MIIENNNDRIIIKAKSRPMILPEENEDPGQLFLAICDAIREGGYNPVSQIVGYILSEDPAHITNYKNARTMMGKLDRDDLLEEMVQCYIETMEKKFEEKPKKND